MFIDDDHLKIKYDCCGTEHEFKRRRVAEKHFKDNGGKHLCRKCQNRSNEDRKDEITAKRKWTCRERFGADNIMQTEEGRERHKAGMQERYGVDFPLQSDEVAQKMNETWLAKYGVQWKKY